MSATTTDDDNVPPEVWLKARETASGFIAGLASDKEMSPEVFMMALLMALTSSHLAITGGDKEAAVRGWRLAAKAGEAMILLNDAEPPATVQ